MAAGIFHIIEKSKGGDVGEVFAWTSDTKPAGFGHGARAAPKSPWSLAGTQRMKRTDYPSSSTPSVQVLGPVYKPFTLEGKFDDRYNFPGFAVAEMTRLEQTIRRGNLCYFSFQERAFVGMISDYQFHYRRDWDIGYVLTVDVHDQPSDFDLSGRSPATVMKASTLLDDVTLATVAVEDFHAVAPASMLQGSLWKTVTSKITALSNALDGVANTLENREKLPPEQAVDGFTRLATQFREVLGSAFGVLVSLADVRADSALSTQTALDVLDFEEWSRSVRYAARIAFASAKVGDESCTERAEPDAIRLYRPQQAESLYAISRKFYGTPHAWRLIYDRNALSSVTLTGDEILIIPARGGA